MRKELSWVVYNVSERYCCDMFYFCLVLEIFYSFLGFFFVTFFFGNELFNLQKLVYKL